MRYDQLQIAKIISTSEEFAQAVKAPKETFGVAMRSGVERPARSRIS